MNRNIDINILLINNIFRSLYLRNRIFKEIGVVSDIERASLEDTPNNVDNYYMQTKKLLFTKGKEIIQHATSERWHSRQLDLVSKFALPWHFVKHYLPPKDTIDDSKRSIAINLYCSHPNATLQTLEMLIDKWSPDFEPNSHVLDDVSEAGHLDILQYLHNRYRDTIVASTNAMCLASQKGYLNIVQWLHANRLEGTTKRAVVEASLNGHLSILKWLIEIRKENNYSHNNALFNAARYGHLDVVKYLHGIGLTGITTSPMDYACENNHLDIVKFLRENRTEGCSDLSIDWAAENGHAEMVEYLLTNKLVERFSKESCLIAATRGHYKVIQLLHQYQSTCNLVDFNPFTPKVLDKAAKNGHLNIVQYLIEHRKEGGTSKAIDSSSKAGHYEIVKYLIDKSFPCTFKASRMASFNGHLSIIELLHENGKPFTKEAMDSAASKGRLDILLFLHNNRTEGCSKDALDKSSKNGHFDIVKFLHFNRTEGCLNAIKEASKGNHLEIVRFLNENRTEVCCADTVTTCARMGHFDVLKYLIDNRSEGCSINTIDQVASMGHLNIIKYLHNHVKDRPMATKRAMDMAANGGYLNIIKFLHSNRSEGCTTDAMDRAAENGYLDICNVRCPGAEALTNAARYGHKSVVQFLVKSYPDLGKFIPIAMSATLSDGNLSLALYLASINPKKTRFNSFGNKSTINLDTVYRELENGNSSAYNYLLSIKHPGILKLIESKQKLKLKNK
ncbi:hypothetical protein DFA_01938 [Cavenderia fasciculata]|uniref:Ankyrin repeat-containing protein n=1 Tax=Cavenderia fasciculata TaxID=261658 RepID=F4PQU1_CACFS|nr:uncharacterized protein DFA_01938 [Cavenderia fasciculata]EGG22049.1 hypothetical protein DFA_01938 [Cavenderia fasciculata]|eukprot:XP_004359900.1 hypothetical protein DFA_01938 [Cavenderia fasciculata]